MRGAGLANGVLIATDAAGIGPALGERLAAVAEHPDEATVGAALMALVAVARDAGVDPEMALRAQAADAAARIRAYERSR